MGPILRDISIRKLWTGKCLSKKKDCLSILPLSILGRRNLLSEAAIPKASALFAFTVTRSQDGRNKPPSALSWQRMEGTSYPRSVMLQLCPERAYWYLHLF